MAATSIFNPPAPKDIELTQEDDIQVPEPLPQEETVKQSGFQRFLPFIMIGVTLMMVIVMFTVRSSMGGGMNPMMFMFPVMMLMSMLMMFAGQNGGNNTGELNKERKDYIYSLRETRKLAHKAGQEVHDVMCKMFPNPAILHNYVGNMNVKDPVMWQYNEENQGGIVAFEGTVDEISFKPYMSARMGTGITNLIPNLTFEPLSVPETLEPVTTTQFRLFVRTQGFIPNIPIGVSLASSGAFAITGDDEKKYGLIRAMLMTLMFNHSPNVLRIAVVTDNVEDPKWQWLKWSQHALHPSATDQLGPYRMIYPNMRTFAQEVPEAIGDATEDRPHWIVVVDKPYDEVTLPQRTGMGTGGYNSTFIVVNAKADRIATSKSARYHIDELGEIALPYTDAKLNGDYASLEEADTFCRSMFCYAPPKTKTDYAAGEDTPAFVHRTWFEVLGIDDIDEWSPAQAWAVNDVDDNLITPLGHEYDEVSQKALERVVFVDASEAAAGGSGPHGIGQGKTGTGKSIMLSAFVLGMVARYSPEKINFLLMDFKGGSTFQRYEKLPHVIASLSNLEESMDLLDRAFLIIQGEIARRQEILDEHDCKDIREYREKRASNPSMDPLPYLFLVVDEFREFITQHREYLKLFESIAAVGRSLGFHMMLVSQFVDSSLIGEASSQIGFGVSLAVSNHAQSRGVIGIDKAAELPSGKGDAIINYKEGPLAEQHSHLRFRTFFTEEIYVPPEREVVYEATTIGQPMEDESINDTVDRILPYTITPQEIREMVDDEPSADPNETSEMRRQREKARRAQIEAEAGKDMMMKNVLIDRVAREPNTPQALQLWKPSMRNPISFDNIDIPQRASMYPKLVSTVGIVDDPYNHRQYLWDVDFSNPRTSNWLLVGARGSGKTVAMEAMIASIAQSYPPDAAQFLILSYVGAKIKEIDAYPHVVGYADGNDGDFVERYLGEIERIVNLRQRYATQWASADANAFLKDKLRTPIEGDPYGRLFLVIDGLGAMMKEAGGSFGEGAMELSQTIGTLLSRGPNVGVHLIASTVQFGDIPYKIRDSFTPMYFSMDDVSDVSDRGARQIIDSIPNTQPGRSVADQKHARVLVPQEEVIEPSGERKGNLIFDPVANYGQNVSSFANKVRNAYVERNATFIPEVVPAPAVFPYQDMWSAYEHVVDLEERNAYLPIGIKTQDLHVVDLKFEADMQHLIVAGEPKSGKTNVLRVLINDVVRQRTNKRAKFLFYDPRNEFFVEERILRRHKMSVGHATSPDEMFDLLEQLTMKLEERIPSEDELSDREQLQSRSWYKGPDFYVVVDNIMDLEKANGFGNDTKLAKFAAVLKTRNDLGCYVFAAARSSEASYLGTNTSKLSEALLNTGSGYLLLSGEKKDGKVGPVGFEKFRPGKGKFYNGNGVSVVQTARALEWEDDTSSET